jgi:molecular chaperone HscB
MDHFQVFGLPRRLAIDGAALQRQFYELSRRHHPDFHAAAPPEAQARALQDSARLNAAYRTLRDPVARIEYLVRLEEGGQPREGSESRPAPPELLAEMFEIQEALAEARAGGLDDESRQALAAHRERLQARRREAETALVGPLAAAWDAAPGAQERARVLRQLREGLAARAYLKTVIDDLSAALGAGDDSVAHHRH